MCNGLVVRRAEPVLDPKTELGSTTEFPGIRVHSRLTLRRSMNPNIPVPRQKNPASAWLAGSLRSRGPVQPMMSFSVLEGRITPEVLASSVW